MSTSTLIRDGQTLPEAIQWHEGMLLAPQHFQQWSLRHDALLHYHSSTISPFHWGIRRFAVDPILLVGGTFRVADLEAIMPDGLIVELAPTQQLELDLGDLADQMKGEPQTVYLIVPAQKAGSAAINTDLARYDSIDSDPIVDENTGEGELEIPRLRPRLSLHVGGAPPSKYVSFPLARVAHRNEMFVLTEYIPPSLQVPIGSPLADMCVQIVRRLREKALYLSEELRARHGEMGMATVIETKLAIRSLVDFLPVVEAILNTGVSHPYPLYLSVCALVGHVAALGSSLVPPVLPAYDHNDLRASFDEARAFILQMLEEGVMESHFVIPFFLKNDLFTLRFSPEWAGRELMIGIKGAPDATEKETIGWLQESLIGSESILGSLRDRRILGATREEIDNEDAFVAARGLSLFSLEYDSTFIVPSEELQIMSPGERADIARPAEVLLFVHKKNNPSSHQ